MTAKRIATIRRRRHMEAADWLLRNRDAGRSDEAQEAFQSWLRQDPENGRAYADAERLMGEARTAILVDPGLAQHDRLARKPIAKAGFVLVLAVGAALAGFLLMDGPMRLQADAMSGTDMPQGVRASMRVPLRSAGCF